MFQQWPTIETVPPIHFNPFFKSLHYLAAIQKKIWCGLGQIDGLNCRLKLSGWPPVLCRGGCLVEVRRLYHRYIGYTADVCQSGHPIYNQPTQGKSFLLPSLENAQNSFVTEIFEWTNIQKFGTFSRTNLDPYKQY